MRANIIDSDSDLNIILNINMHIYTAHQKILLLTWHILYAYLFIYLYTVFILPTIHKFTCSNAHSNNKTQCKNNNSVSPGDRLKVNFTASPRPPHLN